MGSTDDISVRSGLLLALHSDTGESGDSYDIDVQTELIRRTERLGFKSRPVRVSPTFLDTTESGDVYDAEVEQSSGGEARRLVSSSKRA